MSREWERYLKKLVSSLKGVFISLGLALLFYLSEISSIGPGEHLRWLGICVLTALICFFVIWSLYSIAWALIVLNHEVRGGRIQMGWAAHLTLSLSGSTIGLILARWARSVIYHESFDLSGYGGSILIGAFISLMFLFHQAYKGSTLENEKLKTAKAHAELHVLKSQMQPHFLFNSLNSLAELIETDRAHASTMTQKLSDLYREILESTRHQTTTLARELSIVEKYLELEKLRFGERLRFTIQSEVDSPETIFVPALTLQTLVENAVKHGVSRSRTGASIDVRIEKDGEGFRTQIFNSGANMSNERGGYGLANTRSRLDLLYRDRHRFDFRIEGDTARASFWFSGEGHA